MRRPHLRPRRVRGSANRCIVRGFDLYVASRHCAVFFKYLRHTRQTLRIYPSGTRSPISVFFVEDALTHLALSLGDPETHRPLQPLWDWANRLAIPIPLATLIVGTAVWYIGIGRRLSKSPAGRISQHFRNVVPYITVAVVAAVIIRSIMASRYTIPSVHIAPGEAWL